MESEPTFACHTTEVVLQVLQLQQHIEEGCARHAVEHLVQCHTCRNKGYSGISKKTITCDVARAVWLQSPHLLTRPETLEQCLALEHIWLKPCATWMCTCVRDNLAPLRMHIETMANNFNDMFSHCTSSQAMIIREIIGGTQTALAQIHVKIVNVLEQIRKT